MSSASKLSLAKRRAGQAGGSRCWQGRQDVAVLGVGEVVRNTSKQRHVEPPVDFRHQTGGLGRDVAARTPARASEMKKPGSTVPATARKPCIAKWVIMRSAMAERIRGRRGHGDERVEGTAAEEREAHHHQHNQFMLSTRRQARGQGLAHDERPGERGHSPCAKVSRVPKHMMRKPQKMMKWCRCDQVEKRGQWLAGISRPR